MSLSFRERRDALEGTPAPRPPECICPAVVGGWDEACPEHPTDEFSDEAYFLAVEQVIAEHTTACLHAASDYASALGIDSPQGLEQVSAQALADGDTSCVCAPD